MTTVFENPANGYRVKVDGFSSFLWTSIIGPFYFLSRGNIRHFFFGLFLLFLAFPWVIYPFFAASILRTMYNERGYRVVEERATDLKAPLIVAILLVSFIALLIFMAGAGRSSRPAPAYVASPRQRIPDAAQASPNAMNAALTAPPQPDSASITGSEEATQVQRTIPIVQSTSSPRAPEPSSAVAADRFLRAAATEYITSGNSATVEDEMALYAEQVDFYDEGIKNRAQIRSDITSERHRWTQRRYQVSNIVNTNYDPTTDTGSVTVSYTYQLSNAEKRRTGDGITQIVFRSVSIDPKVIRVTEQKR